MIMYIVAYIWDCIITIIGLHYTSGVEGGLVVAPMVELLGPIWGVIVAKSIAVIILLACWVVHRLYLRKGRRSPVPIVLAIGAILTAIGGSLWILQ